jgi:hypothetical protein
MDAEWSTDGIAKFVWPESILPGKDFDSFRKSRPTLDRHSQAKSKIVDVNPALPR